jgi:DNA polymerase I-like protein with 3'-5' exonuclease and polymerase domains
VYRNILKGALAKELYMILPIHDELIFEMHRNLLPYRNEICQRIAKEMTTISDIKVRLDVETKMASTTWNKAKEFTFYGK